MRSMGYESGHWVVKVDAFCYDCFWEYNPVYVKVYRPPEMILDSIMRTPFMYKQGYSKGKWTEIIKKHHDLMEQIEGPTVNAEKVFAGDESEIDAVIESLGEPA